MHMLMKLFFVDRNHIVQYMNKTAKQRYGQRVQIGQSLFQCHNENSRYKIEEFLIRADQGEEEMFELYNQKTGEREIFCACQSGWAGDWLFLKDMKPHGIKNILRFL